MAAARWTHRQAEFDWCQLHLVHRRLTVSHASSMARALSESDPGLGAGGAAQARVMYTCSGCEISFDKKRGFDAHRSHRFARPLCRGGFEQAERLSLAVTSRDFRVRGRHSKRPAPAEDAGRSITWITCNYITLHIITCITQIYTALHTFHDITCITYYYLT